MIAATDISFAATSLLTGLNIATKEGKGEGVKGKEFAPCFYPYYSLGKYCNYLVRGGKQFILER